MLQDVNTNQPAITWNTWNSYTILWEDGAPQFAAGKTNMTVELWGAEYTLYGSFKLFA
ncbi:MAG: hypothetical protein H6988_13685 [Pseudomonadales bacterium]|nr:hypothetical protein [Pseudomonadales bacterium]